MRIGSWLQVTTVILAGVQLGAQVVDGGGGRAETRSDANLRGQVGDYDMYGPYPGATLEDIATPAEPTGPPDVATTSPSLPSPPPSSCSPHTLDPGTMTTPAGSASQRFFTLLKNNYKYQSPAFSGAHQSLCDEAEGRGREWAYCLPISGRKDTPHCAVPDHMDLLVPQTPSTLCYASVLHMLLVDVYEELLRQGVKPALLYGTLLGAIRTGATIPFTEDSDIGYQPRIIDGEDVMQRVRVALWQRGYHMFKYTIWRVCVAPTHPLAANLYDPNKPILTDCCQVPYVDLYAMTQEGSDWNVQFASNDRRIAPEKFEPYSQVHMNGVPFDTVADPVDFLMMEYGPDYKFPRPRTRLR